MKTWCSLLLVTALLISMMAVSGLTVSAATYEKGDVNGDGAVTTADVRLLLATITQEKDFVGAQIDAADMTDNGVVNTADARRILDQAINDLGVATTVSLLAPNVDDWHNPVQTVGTTDSVVGAAAKGSGYVFTNYGGNWPYTVYVYDDKLLLPEDAVIEYDITVNCRATSINLYTGGQLPGLYGDSQPDGATVCKLNSLISSTNIDAGSGDLTTGSYTGVIPVSSLAVADSARVDGMIWVSAIKIYAVGDDRETLTINKLTVSAVKRPVERDIATEALEAVRPTLFDATEVEGLPTLTGMELYVDGIRSAATTMNTAADNKKIYHTVTSQRVVNYPDGYQIDLPVGWAPDLSLAALRTRFTSDEYSLTITKEDQNPYINNGADGWQTYLEEWLNRYIASSSFLSANNLSYMRASAEMTDLLAGYTILRYDIRINDNVNIAMPYYSIAIIRKTTDYKNFHLMVLKSVAPTEPVIDSLLRSFKPIAASGTAVNTQGQYEQIIPDNWSAETLAYYNKLCAQDTTDFGFFTHSMVARNDSTYDSQYENITTEYERLSTAMDFEYDIMPTYTHLMWYNSYNDFPLQMANTFAGGNGFNGKPVLQFTYQFTRNNNGNLYDKTPMYDILRGYHDAQFRELAQDIKAYGKPVLFRLNNEMNTDWTSYAGIVTLLDPDIFIQTWQRLYDIFKEEGVDNCIWIFNPIATTTPYCSWGEHLCYMPGAEYVQMLGLTSYEMGNSASLSSFRAHYQATYNKNVVNFDNLPWIISEFAAGAGGAKLYDWGLGAYRDTTLGRNEAKQAAWVAAMFNELADPNNAYCNKIKGAVWFSANDSVRIDNEYYVTNFLALDPMLDQTLEAFKQGFASQ